MKYLKSANFKNKTTLIRVDVNEPVVNGKLDDDFRIQKVIPTIQNLINRGCKVVMMGHLGRPAGVRDPALSLRPVAERTAELMGLKFIETDHRLPNYPIGHLIFFTGDLESREARQQVKEIAAKDVVFLENIRYYKGEDTNSDFFANQLSELGDLYINEAFADSHRDAASIVGVTKYLPSYAGLLLEREVRAMDAVLGKPKHPFVLMMGGIKISDKAHTLQSLGKVADQILLAGGLANLFLQSAGYEIGISKVEAEAKAMAWQMAKTFKDKVTLPHDVVVGNKNYDKQSIRVTGVEDIKKNEAIYDIGPKTILEFARAIKQAKTLVWNGPLGFFEQKPFDTATMALSRVAGGVCKGTCFGVVGGGETVDALRISGQIDYIDHVSTGGGAMLEYLAGKTLPGIAALG